MNLIKRQKVYGEKTKQNHNIIKDLHVKGKKGQGSYHCFEILTAAEIISIISIIGEMPFVS